MDIPLQQGPPRSSTHPDFLQGDGSHRDGTPGNDLHSLLAASQTGRAGPQDWQNLLAVPHPVFVASGSREVPDTLTFAKDSAAEAQLVEDHKTLSKWARFPAGAAQRSEESDTPSSSAWSSSCTPADPARYHFQPSNSAQDLAQLESHQLLDSEVCLDALGTDPDFSFLLPHPAVHASNSASHSRHTAGLAAPALQAQCHQLPMTQPAGPLLLFFCLCACTLCSRQILSLLYLLQVSNTPVAPPTGSRYLLDAVGSIERAITTANIVLNRCAEYAMCLPVIIILYALQAVTRQR